MTEFERSIKRGMDRDRFFAIRNQLYGDGKNVLRYTYGNIASWLTWNRDKNGDIADLSHPTIPIMSNGGNLWDGGIDTWEQGQTPEFSKKLTVDIVFLGLSLSGDGGKTLPWGMDLHFQNARGVRRIAKTFAGTAAEGAYFTDIIKPDRRFLDSAKLKEGEKISKVAQDQPGALKEHIDLFIEELTFIGAKKPLLIVFGGNAKEIVQIGINTTLRQNFRDIVYIMSYAAYPKGGDDGYKEILRKDLARYITI